MARQAMDIAEGSGLGFCGAMICGILALVEPEPVRQQAAIARGEGLLRESGLSHNHIWFRVFAIERGLASRDWPLAERQIGDLAQYTAAEPLPLIEQMIKRARALVRLGRDPADAASAGELRRLTKEAAERGVFLDARQSTPS
jgi:hypothetical protein